MSESSRAVFLSYASQDADAAGRISEALRAGGIEVWFDQSELRGGDAWDAAIRKQIRECTLFVPIISANTQSREEGYFRREWRMAVDRTMDMTESKAFLLPVVIDDTPEVSALVPEKFREVQWTHLLAGETPASFIERLRRLLSGGATPRENSPRSTTAPVVAVAAPDSRPLRSGQFASRARIAFGIGAAVVIAGIATAVLLQDGSSTPKPAKFTAVLQGSTEDFSPPPHSIAVLPFVNMSGDPKQEYFSDGLSEEVLNALTNIPELQVAARTSSFSFKGKDVSVSDIARKLNVGAILEGSIRADGGHLRITAQLINAKTGFHLWSQSYDRDLKNVLDLETEIAISVTKALQETMLPRTASAIELGGTRNAEAFDAYLRSLALWRFADSRQGTQASIDAADEAVRLDPRFARAYVQKARALASLGATFASSVGDGRNSLEHARDVALQAVVLAPELGAAHQVLGRVHQSFLDFDQALIEYQRAIELSPGDSSVLSDAGELFASIGRPAAAIASAQRAVVLDPLNSRAHSRLGWTLYWLHKYSEAIQAFDRAINLAPNYSGTVKIRGSALFFLGEFDAARRACASPPFEQVGAVCLASLESKLGRFADAHDILVRLIAVGGDANAYQYAEIYAQWGNPAEGLKWLATAYRVRDPGLQFIKVDPYLDPLRGEPRFQEIEKKLKFPV
jgi:TolB-like protein